jgi:uncharacterized protein
LFDAPPSELASSAAAVPFFVREATMNRTDLALLLMSHVAGSPAESYPLDRIRVQKGVFLLTQRGNPAWRPLYTYRPYNWGPYSSQLAIDTDAMLSRGYLESVPGARHGQYRTTATGEDRARQLWGGISEQERSFIRTVRAYVTSRSFTQLLREVYAAYPNYATASQFSG